jgi:hypothetical protein
LWARFAVWLSFLAVLSALAAPASLLAKEVRSGKLGGLCSASQGMGSPQQGDAEETLHAGHCDLCSASALLLPPSHVSARWTDPARQLVRVAALAHHARLVTGLPFSRGPPAL